MQMHPQVVFIERDFVMVNLLVRIHFTIVTTRWTGLAPWEFELTFPGGLHLLLGDTCCPEAL